MFELPAHIEEPSSSSLNRFNSLKTCNEIDTSTINADQKEMTLGNLIKPLINAVQQQRQWIQDFSNDPITLPNDLYEVLLAFEGLQDFGSDESTEDNNAA